MNAPSEPLCKCGHHENSHWQCVGRCFGIPSHTHPCTCTDFDPLMDAPPPVSPSEDELTAYVVPDGPKELRETLCVAQTYVGLSEDSRKRSHMKRLQRLIDECDRHRPIGNDGKHGDRHTPTCGCEDKPCDHTAPVIVSDEDYKLSEGVCAGCGVRMKNDAAAGWGASPSEDDKDARCICKRAYCAYFDEWQNVSIERDARIAELERQAENAWRMRDKANKYAERMAAERDALAQAMWDGWATLGFDTDGDTNPRAWIAGAKSHQVFAEQWLHDVHQHRKEADEADAEWSQDIDRLDAAVAENTALAAKVRAIEAVLAEHCDWKAGRSLHAEITAALSDAGSQA